MAYTEAKRLWNKEWYARNRERIKLRRQQPAAREAHRQWQHRYWKDLKRQMRRLNIDRGCLDIINAMAEKGMTYEAIASEWLIRPSDVSLLMTAQGKFRRQQKESTTGSGRVEKGSE